MSESVKVYWKHMSTTESALTVHLGTSAGYPADAFMDQVSHELDERFSIHHSTLQVEQGTTDHACSLYKLSSSGSVRGLCGIGH